MIKSISIVFLMTLTSCAYDMGYNQKSLPEGHKNISIPMFKNTTSEVGIETFFTNAITREFNRSGIANVIPNSKSKVELIGEVNLVFYKVNNQISDRTAELLMPTGTILTSDYNIRMRARLSLRDKEDGRILWFDDFIGNRAYSAPQITVEGANSANSNYNNSAQRQNIQLLAEEMMTEAHERMTENF